MEVAVRDSFLGLACVNSNGRTGAEIVVGQIDGGRLNSLAVHGELAGVKDVQGAVLQGSLDLGDLLGSAFGNLGSQISDGDSAVLVALGPILRDVASGSALEQLLVADRPDVGGGGQSGGGGGGQHINVVADGVADGAGVLLLLGGGGSAGGVSVLTDDNGTVGDQSLGSSAFLVDVEPGVGVHNFHLDVGVNALHAEEEGGVAGNDLGIAEGADVADLDLAVSGEAVGLGFGGQGAGLDQLLDLHTGNNAGNVAALVHGGEGVVEVVQVGNGSKVAGHGNKVDIGVLLGFLNHVGLVTVGVRDDQVAALTDQVLGGIGGFAALGNLVFPDDLVIADAQLGSSFFNAVDVSGAVALGFVAQNDGADLQTGIGVVSVVSIVSSGGTVAAGGSRAAGSGGTAGCHAEHHRGGQQNAHQFLHVCVSSLKSVKRLR